MERIESIAGESSAGMRLDRFLASIRPDASRSAIQREIRDGNVVVSGTTVRQPAHRLRGGEIILWSLREARPLAPEPVPLSILYEDDVLVAIDKPAGLVVHPGAGTAEATLVEGLLAERSLPESDDPARPGIVHRLDKGTSGVIVVAKTSASLRDLRRQFADRSVAKTYLAVVEGTIEEDEGTIDAPLGRDPVRPRRMAVAPRGRPAQTEFRVLSRMGDWTLLRVSPRTGRTHQIRAHLRFIGHPVVGDPVYGRSTPARAPASGSDSRSTGRRPGLRAHVAQEPTRMLLHAWRLAVRHPETGEELRLVAPPPSEFPDYPYEELPWEPVSRATDEE